MTPASTVLKAALESRVLKRSWLYSVYLPAGYEHSNATYPTLYLLHARGGDTTSWLKGGIRQILDALIAAAEIPALIAIMPAAAESYYVDGLEPFETAFIKDLVPEIDERFRTIQTRSQRILAGCSMGGYGALRYALEYPELFGAAILLSPAVYEAQPPPGSSTRTVGAFGVPFDPALWTARNYPTALERFRATDLETRFFIVAGDDEYANPDGFLHDLDVQAVHLFARLRHAGVRVQLRIRAGGHGWEVWMPGLTEGLASWAFIFGG